MAHEKAGQMNFFSEMSEHQISAREFFCTILLDSLDRNFGLKETLITYFDTHGKFLSWITRQGLQVNCEGHPYRRFIANDIVRHIVFEEAVRDELTYFNVEPRLYKSTDIISPVDYEHSAYVRFLEENFHSHYSVTMAFGINAYIQISVFKSKEKGDFTPEQIETLKAIYVYVANAYKNFKKYEQAKIVASIQSEIIASGEKAYLVTDDFMHIMSYNNAAQKYLKDIWGNSITEEISTTMPCNWLPFLLGDATGVNHVQTRVIKNYIFKIYTYDQTYSNGIVDRYHWITISIKAGERKAALTGGENTPLTHAEQKVAELLYAGLTYKAIADELMISYHTVKKHVQNIYTKCDVNSRFELYKWLENAQNE
ncbi:MAG: helix-turn-helix transcriptional regulator [Hespellia sp.]|nr:helix-turn-helix transcriptional regulator [Hespellia sp.]